MIISHILQMADLKETPLYVISTKILFSFMAFFFWKSGRFYKEIEVKKLIKKDFEKLIEPYFIWIFISFLYESVTGLYNQTIFQNWKSFIREMIFIEAPGSNAALWFLPTLFLCHVLFRLMNKYFNPFIICVLSFVISWGINYLGISKPIWIGNIPYAITFYSFGYLFRTTNSKVTIFVASVFAIIYIIYPNYVGARDNVFVYGNNYPLAIACSMAFIVLYYNCIRKLNIRQNLLSFIGRNSMAFYISHYIFLCLCNFLLNHCGISGALFATISGTLLIPYFFLITKINEVIRLY